MRVTFALALAILLHSEVTVGLDPTYQELKSQLPIELKPNGDDQFFFFIVPVQKNDDPNVILQMAQVQDASKHANGTLSSTKVNTLNNTVNVSPSGSNLNLSEVFTTPRGASGSGAFNFQVPVVVPLDFRFRADGTELPQCTVDSRTWKEKVISKIAEKMNLEEQLTWDHNDLTIRIRLRKDVLSSITLDHITNTDELGRYVSTITQTKYLTDIRYTNILNDIVTLSAEHIAIISEGVDTYHMIGKTIAIAEEAATILDADNANDQNSIETARIQINAVKDGAESAFDKFKLALIAVRKLQQEEAAKQNA